MQSIYSGILCECCGSFEQTDGTKWHRVSCESPTQCGYDGENSNFSIVLVSNHTVWPGLNLGSQIEHLSNILVCMSWQGAFLQGARGRDSALKCCSIRCWQNGVEVDSTVYPSFWCDWPQKLEKGLFRRNWSLTILSLKSPWPNCSNFYPLPKGNSTADNWKKSTAGIQMSRLPLKRWENPGSNLACSEIT